MEKFAVTVREVLPGQSLDLLYCDFNSRSSAEAGQLGQLDAVGIPFSMCCFPPQVALNAVGPSRCQLGLDLFILGPGKAVLVPIVPTVQISSGYLT